MKVVVQAICIIKEGYGYQGIMSAMALKNAGHEVTMVSAKEYGVDSTLPPVASQIFSKNLPSKPVDVNLAVTLPVKYINHNRSEPRNIIPTACHVSAIEAVWEAAKIPSTWVRAFNKGNYNLIVVPHVFSKEIFIDSGVTKPIEVLYSGVDRRRCQVITRTKGEDFFFLQVGRMEPRKNSKVTLDAFQYAFPKKNYPYVGLVIKTRPDAIPDYLSRAANIDRRIVLKTRDLTEEKLVELYNACHCFVYPSRGEGFSYPPRDAIATGMPTIVTKWSAMRDIPGATFVEPCGFSPMPENPFSNGEEANMLMADVNYNELGDVMRDVYDNYDAHVARTIEEGCTEMDWTEYPKEFERVFAPWL